MVFDPSTFNFAAADEELILDIDKVLRLLDHLNVGIHDAMLSMIWRA